MLATCTDLKKSPREAYLGALLQTVESVIVYDMVLIFTAVYPIRIHLPSLSEKVSLRTLTPNLTVGGSSAGLHAGSASPLSPLLTKAVTAPSPAVRGKLITPYFAPDGLSHVRPRSRGRPPPGTDSLLCVEHIEVHYLVVPPIAEEDVGASILHAALRGIYIIDTDPCKILVHSWCDLRDL